MADNQSSNLGDTGSDTSPRWVSRLGEGSNRTSERSGPIDVDAKSGKRRFWQLSKKKEDDKAKQRSPLTSVNTPPTTAPRHMLPVSPSIGGGAPVKQTISHPYAVPSSPSRNLNSSSPGIPSPASSQIFERSVQEDGLVSTASPAIPAHITTENHIPPVLDASSEAITNDHLNPDNVAIVMHSAHQPAAVTVTGAGTSEAVGSSWSDDTSAHPDNDDAASNYGALDSTDVRRLSFISFADVVHAEHVDHSSGAVPSISSPLAASMSRARSSSPARSPISSKGLGGSPVTSTSESSKGWETSPHRGLRGAGSALSGHSPTNGGELTIETMRQALRKTGSGDLSGARSQPLSATEATAGHSFGE